MAHRFIHGVADHLSQESLHPVAGYLSHRHLHLLETTFATAAYAFLPNASDPESWSGD